MEAGEGKEEKEKAKKYKEEEKKEKIPIVGLVGPPTWKCLLKARSSIPVPSHPSLPSI